MQKIAQYLKSRAVWTIIFLFLVNGIEGIRESIPSDLLPIINAVLGLAAIYFRIKPKQKFE